MTAIEQHFGRLARIRGSYLRVDRQPATWSVALVYDRHVVATGAGRTLELAAADLERAAEKLGIDVRPADVDPDIYALGPEPVLEDE